MKKVLVCLLITVALTSLVLQGTAEGKVTWIDPTYNPTGLMAGFYGYSEAEYMNYVTDNDTNMGRAANHGAELKGIEIGEVGVYFTNVYEQKLSDSGLAFSLAQESLYTMNYNDAAVEELLQTIISQASGSARIWLMSSEIYGWGECEYGVMSEYEYYLFRIETAELSTAFIAECYSNYEGGEGVEVRFLSTGTRND